ncbi:MAG: dihydroneopterin aldolase [Bacteroidetes bacterium]|nr:dihydroneopterin aldolase [Bacteroidota bacterium]
MLYIALNNIQLIAYHGLYPEEHLLGNHFIVQCKVGINDLHVHTIDDTIDYNALLTIIKKHFNQQTPLLETLAQQIEMETKQLFPAILYFYLSIKKKHPALAAQIESSEIIIEKNYAN